MGRTGTRAQKSTIKKPTPTPSISYSPPATPTPTLIIKSATMSRCSYLLIILILLFFLVASSSTTRLQNPNSRNHQYRYPLNRREPPSCSSFPHKNSRSLCIHFHRMNPQRRLNPSPPPPPPASEIDPRYGVETRLVPSGPNPLHN
ncbi:hypothetical protein JCGZ_15685 [Jatropha curcas]|uniref:Uncharacterized protein n=1 Tax=Jatropha curcas TaxID=180498 RepID=A0A067L254_JATCU|nr:hypothetical protein JCGZ_15685 [Jatropha curcas]